MMKVSRFKQHLKIVILQSDTKPKDEDESSEEDFEIETADQTNNSINVESQTCYSKDKNVSDSPVVRHSSKAVNTFEANDSNLDVLIFAETLLKHPVRKKIREKEQLKWNSKIRELKVLSLLYLKVKAKVNKEIRRIIHPLYVCRGKRRIYIELLVESENFCVSG